MPASVSNRPCAILRWLLLATVAANMAACASYNPTPIEQIPFKQRAEMQTIDGITVTTTVLSREEAKQAFGVNLEKRGIQPVWFRIENDTNKRYRFMLSGVDPNYFSAHEAAYMNHFFWGGKTNKEMDAYFDSLALNPTITPGESTEGFVFSNQRIGTKEVRVRMITDDNSVNLTFFIEVPGFNPAWDKEAIHDTYAEDEFVDYTDVLAFLDAVSQLPCCTARPDGSLERDPLNIVLVGDDAVLQAFVKAGWKESNYDAWQSLRTYVGGLNFDGRPPDAGLYKARAQTRAGIWAVFWLTRLRFEGESVWVGSISRDVDSDVDEARTYLAEDLLATRTVSGIGFTTGVGVVEPDKPRLTVANLKYHTDGDRYVIGLSREEVPLEQVDFYGIEERRQRLEQRRKDAAAKQP